MAHWRYYGNNTGAPVGTAYAKHAAHLLYRVTHNHQPEVREAAAIRIKEVPMARNACPRWILAQHGVPFAVGTSIWAQLQLLPPHHTPPILMNHHCDQQGPLMATHTDIRRHPAGEVDTLRLVGAIITIVYITPTKMRVMAQCSSPTRNGQHAASSKHTSAHALRRQGARCRDQGTLARRTRPLVTSSPSTAAPSTRSPPHQPKAGQHPPSCC